MCGATPSKRMFSSLQRTWMIMDDEGMEAAATVEEASRLYIDLLDYIDAL